MSDEHLLKFLVSGLFISVIHSLWSDVALAYTVVVFTWKYNFIQNKA